MRNHNQSKVKNAYILLDRCMDIIHSQFKEVEGLQSCLPSISRQISLIINRTPDTRQWIKCVWFIVWYGTKQAPILVFFFLHLYFSRVMTNSDDQQVRVFYFSYSISQNNVQQHSFKFYKFYMSLMDKKLKKNLIEQHEISIFLSFYFQIIFFLLQWTSYHSFFSHS